MLFTPNKQCNLHKVSFGTVLKLGYYTPISKAPVPEEPDLFFYGKLVSTYYLYLLLLLIFRSNLFFVLQLRSRTL